MKTVNRPNEFEYTITSMPDSLSVGLKAFLKSRELIWVLTKRELMSRYGTGSLRHFWTLLKPVLFIALYLSIMVGVLRVNHSVSKYALIIISGLLVWQPFIENIHSIGKSIVYDANLIKRSNIPRLIFPVYRTLVAVPEIAVIFLILVCVILYTGHLPSSMYKLLLLPFAFLLNYLLVLGISLWSNIWYFLNPGKSQLLFTVLPFLLWVTPVFYLPEMVPPAFRHVLLINPFSSVVCLFRYILMDMPLLPAQWLPGAAIIIAIVIGGLIQFIKQQDFFAEKI